MTFAKWLALAFPQGIDPERANALEGAYNAGYEHRGDMSNPANTGKNPYRPEDDPMRREYKARMLGD